MSYFPIFIFSLLFPPSGKYRIGFGAGTGVHCPGPVQYGTAFVHGPYAYLSIVSIIPLGYQLIIMEDFPRNLGQGLEGRPPNSKFSEIWAAPLSPVGFRGLRDLHGNLVDRLRGHDSRRIGPCFSIHEIEGRQVTWRHNLAKNNFLLAFMILAFIRTFILLQRS
ncbi:hypothetical protein HOY82DRAFT_554496 [Tuber indicum]|nr:hypothetical protein HOY82DRAFT_554496 [Tuber indicum]